MNVTHMLCKGVIDIFKMIRMHALLVVRKICRRVSTMTTTGAVLEQWSTVSTTCIETFSCMQCHQHCMLKEKGESSDKWVSFVILWEFSTWTSSIELMIPLIVAPCQDVVLNRSCILRCNRSKWPSQKQESEFGVLLAVVQHVTVSSHTAMLLTRSEQIGGRRVISIPFTAKGAPDSKLCFTQWKSMVGTITTALHSNLIIFHSLFSCHMLVHCMPDMPACQVNMVFCIDDDNRAETHAHPRLSTGWPPLFQICGISRSTHFWQQPFGVSNECTHSVTGLKCNESFQWGELKSVMQPHWKI